MASAIVAVIGSLLGVALGFLAQSRQARHAHEWLIADALSGTKRQVYAEYLRSISASYAQAKVGQAGSEDANILKATAEIELLADSIIAREARQLSTRVIDVHSRLRVDPEVEQSDVPEVDEARMKLIELFKRDLLVAPPRPVRGA